MSNKVEHLKIIQSVITRMSGNLFLLKGWSITLIVAIFTIVTKDIDDIYIILSFCVLIIFWTLDGYFLSRERCFRDLYNEIRKKNELDIDFSMNYTKHRVGKNGWIKSMFSTTLNVFYGSLLFVMIAVTMMSKFDIKLNFEISPKNNNIQATSSTEIITNQNKK